MSLVLDEHRQYLTDKIRTALFRKAIHEVVRPGDRVLDLGAGTGILGLLACEAGAARVYAVDAGGMIQVAREVARANGFGDRVVGIEGISTRIELPEKVDVIVADQIGHFGIEAGVLEYFRDGARRFLKPGGRTIPSRIDLMVGATNFLRGWRNVEFWNTRPGGFDFSPARKIAANTGYPTEHRLQKLLSAPARLVSLDAIASPPTFDAETTLAITRTGAMHGISGWFSAQLSPSVVMTNNPASPRAIERRNAFFPIDKELRVRAGDRVRVAMNITPEQTLVTWRVEVSDKSGAQRARFLHSTMRGMLMTPDGLLRTRRNFVPRLTRWGQARRSVVELCDGRRTIAEIEDELFRRHRDIFDSHARAAEFVAEVTKIYAEPTAPSASHRDETPA